MFHTQKKGKEKRRNKQMAKQKNSKEIEAEEREFSRPYINTVILEVCINKNKCATLEYYPGNTKEAKEAFSACSKTLRTHPEGFASKAAFEAALKKV